MFEWAPGRKLDAELARLMGRRVEQTSVKLPDGTRSEMPMIVLEENHRVHIPALSTDDAQVGALLAWLTDRGDVDIVTIRRAYNPKYCIVTVSVVPDNGVCVTVTGRHSTIPGAFALATREALAVMETSHATE